MPQRTAPLRDLFNYGISVYLEVRKIFLNVTQTKFVVESLNLVGKKNRSLHSGGENSYMLSSENWVKLVHVHQRMFYFGNY